MEKTVPERAILVGEYILATGATVRDAAKVFGVSKSTVHKDVHERLRSIHPGLFLDVQQVLKYHRAVRHLRGGDATKRRWQRIREEQTGNDRKVTKS